MPAANKTPNQILRFKGEWRACQKRILDRYAYYSRDKKFHIAAAPGSGKTTLGIELIKRINRPTLVLAPSITIREQWVERICEAFLIEPDAGEQYISQSLKEPGLITVATYQALHRAMTGFRGRSADGDNDNDDSDNDDSDNDDGDNDDSGEPEAAEEVDYSNFDVIKQFRLSGLGTLCLDECHHLRNEWWKALEEFKKSFPEIFTVALTATPPYDSTIAMWERYIGVCGDIDEEITVPELVKENTLCPHQDYVYFNYPTEQETKQLAVFRENARSVFKRLMDSEEFCEAVRGHRFFSGSAGADELLENPRYLSSMIIFLNEKGVRGANRHQRLLGYKRLEPMSLKWMEVLLQGFLYDDADSFPAAGDMRANIIKELKARGLIEKKKVMLLMNNAVEKILINSVGKCGSIKKIAMHEYANTGRRLRMLILTDYIRREYESALGDEARDVNNIGVLPIFEQLRRESAKRGAGLRLGVLCGSVVIIPAEAREAFLKLADEPSGISFRNAGRLSDYVTVEITGDRHFITGIVSELFASGYIQALIGTKSLLGEGWDSPCINSLILASFVGSYMLSNQMRGRAIRVFKQDPEKTSNIWHLVCVKPKDKATGAYDDGAGGDYQTLCRRMENFMGVNYEQDTIESGISRLTAVKLPFSHANVKAANEKMLALSSQRTGLKERWQRSLAIFDRPEIVEEAELKARIIPTVVFNDNLRRLLISVITLIAAGIIAALIAGALSLKIPKLMTAAFVLVSAAGIFMQSGKLYKFKNPMARLEFYGKGIRRALERANRLESAASRAEAEGGSGTYAVCLRGGTGHDKALFAKCVSEFFDPVDNQRYILYNKKRKNRLDGFFVVPEIFSKRREDAELFACCMKPFIGAYEAVYTRNEEGRRLLLKGRARALANRQERCFTRKKVKSALE